MYCDLSMKMKCHTGHEDHGCILFAFVSACVVDKNPNTPNSGSMAEDAITWDGIQGLDLPCISVVMTLSDKRNKLSLDCENRVVKGELQPLVILQWGRLLIVNYIWELWGFSGHKATLGDAKSVVYLYIK